MTDKHFVGGGLFGVPGGTQQMSPEEITARVKRMLGADAVDLNTLTYDELCKTLSVAQYIADLCLKELEDRGELEFEGDAPLVPHLIPEEMIVQTCLVGEDAPPKH